VKTIIKILIAAAILNAAVRVGYAYAGFYQLEDAAQQLLTFGAQAQAGEIQRRMLEKAKELNVPLSPDDIEVKRDGLKTIASVAYTLPVEVFPNYKYPIDFEFSVNSVSLAGLGTGQGQPPP
jgi:hypothetical protein